MPNHQLKTVLCVDDDADIASVLQASLCLLEGIDAHIAPSGEEAVDRAFELRPDLILLDVMMPGQDGPATLRQLRQHALLAPIPVVFLTAQVFPGEKERLLQLGALAVIEKPFDPGTLGQQLKAIWSRDHVTPTKAVGTVQSVIPAEEADSLVDSFIARVARDVTKLQLLVVRAHQNDATAWREIDLLTHSLRGTAALFGYTSLSESCESIERLAGQCAEGARAKFESLGELAALNETLVRAARELDSVEPECHAMFQGLGRRR